MKYIKLSNKPTQIISLYGVATIDVINYNLGADELHKHKPYLIRIDYNNSDNYAELFFKNEKVRNDVYKQIFNILDVQIIEVDDS